MCSVKLYVEFLKFKSQLQGLEDESSVCVKHSLQAVSLCLHSLLVCSKYKLAVSLLEAIYSLVDNPYWLIKVSNFYFLYLS